MTSVIAVLLAAGQGQRYESIIPKQYTVLGQLSIVGLNLKNLLSHSAISAVQPVIHPQHEDLYGREYQMLCKQSSDAVKRVLKPVYGGDSRQDSVYRALQALSADKWPFVIIHDAARPILPSQVLDNIILALQAGKSAIMPVLPVADSMRYVDEESVRDVERDNLYHIQTPQGFAFAPLWQAHQQYQGHNLQDDIALIRKNNMPIHTIPGDIRLHKLTRKQDLLMLRAFLQEEENNMVSYDIRTGQGFDVHRLVPGNHITLGGASFSSELTLEGHSDADVVLHALTDALLGAVGQGDIGLHFPPTEECWRGVSSCVFLKHALDLVSQAGGVVNHVDITIIAQHPKIAPWRIEIRKSLCNLLSLPAEKVGLKATTTEGLGFCGRGEGIAVQAVATVICR